MNQIATLSDAALEQWYPSYPFDVRPVTDDAPFFWHFVSFRRALATATTPSSRMTFEEGLGERLLVVLVAVAALLGAAFVLAPLALRRTVWREIPFKRWTALYFGALGLGFMFFEVSLIQRLTLFLGYPTYSLSVTLFAILLSSGVGAFASERLLGARRPPLGRLLVVLALLVAFYLWALSPLVGRLVGAPLVARILVAVGVVAPLGLCLGVFMPMGLRVVQGASRHPEEYVAWAWAINGFCSVVSSILATIVSMVLGFDAVMVLALGVYAIGIAALSRIPWRAATA